MIVISKNFRLKLEEILKGDLPAKAYNDTEKNVLKLIRLWFSDSQTFEHTTSGSTGKPKVIMVDKEKIKTSANATMEYIDPEGALRKSLLCLNPRHIGGAMVVYRAIIYDQDLVIAEPSANPFDEPFFLEEEFDLTSMVPLQFKSLSANQIDRFKVILIGGAPMPLITTKFKAQVYETFGMTETVSHVALRSLDKAFFKTVGDVVTDTTSEGTLKIKGSVTNNEWIITNDVVDLASSSAFKWIGRRDFIINTGGVKVNPEKVEAILSEQLTRDFILGSLPDERLGRKVVLISDGDPVALDFSTLERYERPKETYFNCQIFKTSSGKIDRRKTQRFFENTPK
ncbi:MAG: AMP-binding protein [Bacteroidota bacterium]